MSARMTQPLIAVAEVVSDVIGGTGFAFVEDDQVEALAEVLDSFFTANGIPTNPRLAARHFSEIPAYASIVDPD